MGADGLVRNVANAVVADTKLKLLRAGLAQAHSDDATRSPNERVFDAVGDDLGHCQRKQHQTVDRQVDNTRHRDLYHYLCTVRGLLEVRTYLLEVLANGCLRASRVVLSVWLLLVSDGRRTP